MADARPRRTVLDAHRAWLIGPALDVYAACEDANQAMVGHMRQLLSQPWAGPSAVGRAAEVVLAANTASHTSAHWAAALADPTIQAAAGVRWAALVALDDAGFDDEDLAQEPVLAGRDLRLGFDRIGSVGTLAGWLLSRPRGGLLPQLEKPPSGRCGRPAPLA